MCIRIERRYVFRLCPIFRETYLVQNNQIKTTESEFRLGYFELGFVMIQIGYTTLGHI